MLMKMYLGIPMVAFSRQNSRETSNNVMKELYIIFSILEEFGGLAPNHVVGLSRSLQ